MPTIKEVVKEVEVVVEKVVETPREVVQAIETTIEVPVETQQVRAHFEGVVGGVVCDAEHCAQHPLGRRIHTVDVCSLWQVVTTEVQRLEQVMVTVDGPPTEIEKIREVMVRHGTTCTRRLVSA